MDNFKNEKMNLQKESQQKRDYFISFTEIIVRQISHSIYRIYYAQLEEFIKVSSECVFLFDNDIKSYIKELLDKAVELKHVSDALKIDILKYHSNFYDINHENYNKNANKKIKLYRWFSDEYNNIENRFKKYLDFSN